jgi:predicted DNA-binding WGR domain protein
MDNKQNDDNDQANVIQQTVIEYNEEEKSAYIYMTSTQYGSDKFWECSVDGVDYNVHFGSRDGKHDNRRNKTYNSHEDAMTEMNKKVRNKQKNGGYN